MKLLLSYLAFSVVSLAAFNPHAWTHRRPIRTASGAFNRIVADAALYGSSVVELRDVRLVRGGVEVPYVIKTLSSIREEQRLTPALVNKAAIPNVGVQAILHLTEAGIHNRLTIATSRRDFRQTVHIEASDDGVVWGMVRRDGVIFDVSSADRQGASLSVSYPDSTQKFVRLTIQGWEDPTWLESASLSLLHESPAEREVGADVAPRVEENKQERETFLYFDLGVAQPCDRILFTTAERLFSRAVSVATSSDGKLWSPVGYATLARSSREDHLQAELSEQWQRYFRVAISNNDNVPLRISSARFERVRREIVFPVEQGSSYWLYSGNPEAEEAHYDLAAVLPASPPSAVATLGAMERNPIYEAPKPPASEQLPRLLTGLLFLLVPVVGAVAYKMLRQANVSK